MRIAYLVPEFPGQTHAFFWREIEQIERLGATVDIVSTRRPSQAAAPHAWARQAIARTTYLYPMSVMNTLGAFWQLFKSGPAAWWRCGAMIAQSPRLAARMTAIAVIGARLARLSRQRGWTHLHVHSCADAANIALFTHELCGLPYSLTLHGDLRGYGPNQANKWKHASFAIVVCEALRQQVKELIGTQTRLTVAPMGVDADAFCRRKPYMPFRSDGPLRVFSCGRLHPGKGHEDLIRAIAQVRQGGLDARLTIAGEDATGGQYKARLEALINECGLPSFVNLAGALSEEAVRVHLEAAHLFVLASHQEALGVATMEAMAMELPVIVTRTGGVAELVEEGQEGLLVETQRPKLLAAAIQRLASTPATCTLMGQAGRSKVRRNYHCGLSARAIVDGITLQNAHIKSAASMGDLQHRNAVHISTASTDR